MKQELQPRGNISVLFVVTFGSFLTQIMVSSLNIALPALQTEFHMQASTLAWVQTAYLLATAVCMVPAGRLADMIGGRKTYSWGMVIYTVATLFCAVSFSSAFLIGLRIVQGIGAALVFATGMAVLTSSFPPGQRGRAIGLLVAGSYIGLCVGPVIGGVITQHFGWRLIFWAALPLGIFVSIMAFLKIKSERSEPPGGHFDFLGCMIYGAALIMLMMGLTRLPNLVGVGLVLAGLVGLVVFYFCERTKASPVLDMSLFRNKVFALSSVAALINYAATFAIVFLLSLYLQYIKGLTPQHAGTILVVQPAAMAIFSPLVGRFSDRTNPRLMAAIGMVITGLALLRLAMLDSTSNLWVLMINLGVLGLGFSLFVTPNTNLAMSAVEKRHLGIASGAVSTMRLIGQLMSMGIAALVFTLIMGDTAITPALYPQFLTSVRISFLIFGLMCLAGVYPSLGRGGGKSRAGG